MGDHFPWHDALLIVPGAAPAPPPAQRFVKRGFYMICCECGLTIDYCKGHGGPPVDVGSTDMAHASADLARRIAECKESK
jgi:hypothetical protein